MQDRTPIHFTTVHHTSNDLPGLQHHGEGKSNWIMTIPVPQATAEPRRTPAAAALDDPFMSSAARLRVIGMTKRNAATDRR